MPSLGAIRVGEAVLERVHRLAELDVELRQHRMDAARKRHVDRELHAVRRIDDAVGGETLERLGIARVDERAAAVERRRIAGVPSSVAARMQCSSWVSGLPWTSMSWSESSGLLPLRSLSRTPSSSAIAARSCVEVGRRDELDLVDHRGLVARSARSPAPWGTSSRAARNAAVVIRSWQPV